MRCRLVASTDKATGPFRADILCKDIATDSWVLVENQLERTDHIHLGQLLTYASGLEAVTIVWITGFPSGLQKTAKPEYAWRRTVSGWCFSIGADGPPPVRWEFDGPEAPTGFPGKACEWGSGPCADGVNRNWR